MRSKAAGALLDVLLGTWLLVQVFKGDALQRLGVL